MNKKQLNWLGTILGVVVGLAVVRYVPGNQLGQWALFMAITFVLVLPFHELGHAMAGALVGFRITAVIIGVGRPLLAFKILGASVQINLLPFSGMTMGLPSGGARLLRLRHWIFIAGGPAAQVLIYFVLRRVFATQFQDLRNHQLLATAISVNWFVLALNLIPFRQADGQPSDGYGLFTIPFWSKAKIADALVTAEMSPAMLAVARDDHDTAGRLAEEVHRRHPEHPVPMLVLGNALHARRQHEAARAMWREALARASEPRLVGMLKNNIAFMAVVIGRDEDLLEADRFSQEAMVVLPAQPAIIGTRGAVLTRLGRAAEGLPLLERSDVRGQVKMNQANSKALIASALAAVGRVQEAKLKLIAARSLDPGNELIARAEADVAAGPLTAATATATATAPSPGPDLVAQAETLRRWRRDARILAFVGLVVMIQGFGSTVVAPTVIAIVLTFVPELAGVAAFAACCLGGAALRAAGFVDGSGLSGHDSAAALPMTLALGLGAGWLLARHRRMGSPAPSRVPTVLGWVLAGLGMLFALPSLLQLALGGSAFSWYRTSRTSAELVMLSVALAAVLVTRRSGQLRLLAALPGALAITVIACGSSWFLERVALAGIPAEGAALVWSEPKPATVLRSASIPGQAKAARLSPGGDAFLVSDAGPAQDDGRRRLRLRAGTFKGRLVELEGAGGAFVDDDRVLVVRIRPGPTRVSELVALRPFADLTPEWTKPLPVELNGFVQIEVDRRTGDVHLWERFADDDAFAAFHTTTAGSTPVDVAPVTHQKGDDFVAHHFSPDGWAAMLVGRRSASRTTGLWLRAASGDRRIIATDWGGHCPQMPPGARAMWCWLPGAILVRIDVETAAVTRVPGFAPSYQVVARDASHFTLLRHREVVVVDVDGRRAARLTLPDSDDDADVDLAYSGFATVAKIPGGKDTKLVVYAEP